MIVNEDRRYDNNAGKLEKKGRSSTCSVRGFDWDVQHKRPQAQAIPPKLSNDWLSRGAYR